MQPSTTTGILKRSLASLLVLTVFAYAQGNTWNKVRYNGGTIQSTVDPEEWNNQLTITADTITLRLKDGQSVAIPTASVTGLSYGQEAHRRVGTMIALGILVAPLALFGLFHKTRLHYIGIEYTLPEGKKGGLLLQGDKDNYRAILMALRGATRAPVAVSEEDRKYVPTAIGATVVKETSSESVSQAPTPTSSQPVEVKQPAAPATPPQPESPPTSAPAISMAQQVEPATVVIKSSPDGAEITVDGKFVGSTPSTVRLAPGDHDIMVEKKGSTAKRMTGGEVTLPNYKVWKRTLTVSAGGSLTIDATLERFQ